MIFHAVALATALFAQGASPIIDVSRCDAGDVYPSSAHRCVFSISNNSDRSVHLTAIHALRAGDQVHAEDLVIGPHDSSDLAVDFNLLADAGETQHNFEFITDLSDQQRGGGELRAFVQSVLDDPTPKLDFGVVSTKQLATAVREVTLESHETSQLRVTKIIDAPGYLGVRIGEDGRTVKATVKNNIGWGIHRDGIVVALDAPHQASARIAVDIEVHGDVVPSSNPVNFDLVHRGGNNATRVRLDQADGKDFRIGRIILSHFSGSARVEPCIPEKKGCRMLELTIDDKQPLGVVIGEVEVELPDYRRVLPIRVYGLVLAEDAVVRDLNGPGSTNGTTAVTRMPKVDLASAIKKKTEESQEPQTPGRGPLLKWEVANEAPIYGYLIYRAEAKDGTFLRVNPQIVHASKDVGDGISSAYQWRDEGAQSGKTYWYYIDSIGKDGSKSRITDPQQAVAK